MARGHATVEAAHPIPVVCFSKVINLHHIVQSLPLRQIHGAPFDIMTSNSENTHDSAVILRIGRRCETCLSSHLSVLLHGGRWDDQSPFSQISWNLSFAARRIFKIQRAGAPRDRVSGLSPSDRDFKAPAVMWLCQQEQNQSIQTNKGVLSPLITAPQNRCNNPLIHFQCC